MHVIRAGAAALLAAALHVGPAFAAPISSFEAGLAGWQVAGDVSIQMAAFGMPATEGSRYAFLTTVTTTNSYQAPLIPFSSNYAMRWAEEMIFGPYGPAPREDSHCANWGPTTCPANFAGGSAIQTNFFVASAGTLTFDVNSIGQVSYLYYSLGAADGSYRMSEGFRNSPPGQVSGVNFCEHVMANLSPAFFFNECQRIRNSQFGESGWRSVSVVVPTAGFYNFGFGIANATTASQVASGVAFDNVRFQAAGNPVPVPPTLPLVVLALALMAGFVGKRKRPASGD
jgi:hypothetical protein